MRVTTWGELDDSWLGREVIVRWEDATDYGPDSLSGVPHERRGVIITLETFPSTRYELHEPDIGGYTSGFPAHAHVQEVSDV